jgi:hypothetical protein
MKMKRITLTVMACLVLLCSATYAATTQDDPCNEWKLNDSVDAASYVVVTQLQGYLPNNRGKHEVIMSLRGDIPIGTYVDNYAPPLIRPEDDFGMSGGVAKGSYVLFMGQDYTKDRMYYHLDYFKCHGRFDLTDSDY